MINISKDTIGTRLTVLLITIAAGVGISLFIASQQTIDYTRFSALSKTHLKNVTWSKSNDEYDITGVSKSNEKIEATGKRLPAINDEQSTVYISQGLDSDSQRYYINQKDFIQQQKHSNNVSRKTARLFRGPILIMIIIGATFFIAIGNDENFRH